MAIDQVGDGVRVNCVCPGTIDSPWVHRLITDAGASLDALRVDTTQIYLHADMALKESAIERTTPPDARPGRYRPPDTVPAFLQAL